MQRKSLVTILAVAGGALIVVVALVIASLAGGSKQSVDTSNLQMVSSINEMLRGIPQQGIALGNPKAKLTLVEFADPQCSACASFSTDALPELIQNYVRTGKLRIVFEGQTIVDHARQDSNRLLRMALAAGEQNKFWSFAEIIYANQGSEDSGYATDAYLKLVANAIPGLDTTKALSDSKSSAFAGVIKQAKNRWDAEHFVGTPAFLLGRTGQKPTERIAREIVPSYKDLAAMIDRLLRS